MSEAIPGNITEVRFERAATAKGVVGVKVHISREGALGQASIDELYSRTLELFKQACQDTGEPVQEHENQ